MADLDQQLADGVASGRLTDGDAYAVSKFAEFLRHAGPQVGPLTAEQQAFRVRLGTDPEWREFLGPGEEESGG